VSPPEIEEALKRIPLVADALVVGVPIAGQPRICAFVIPARGCEPREAEVIAAAAAIMAGFKVPARVWFVESFPTTESPNGVKVQRAPMRELALRKLAEG
jgi:fatty-acyl-CoA synthase